MYVFPVRGSHRMGEPTPFFPPSLPLDPSSCLWHDGAADRNMPTFLLWSGAVELVG